MRSALILVSLAGVACAPTLVRAAPPNLYVVDENSGSLREYTTGGVQVGSTTTIPAAGSGTDLQHRDLIVDVAGRLHNYNGTGQPQLTTRDTGGVYSNRTHPSWNTVNNVSYGGIAAFGDSVFVTDTETGSNTENGIVRFDYAANTSTRFASGTNFTDLNVGLDGLLYALNDSGQVHVFNPTSLAPIRNFSLAASFDDRGIAVDATGNIFVATWDGPIVKFNSNGVFQTQIASGTTNLMDIDVFVDGTVIVGGRFSEFMVTNTSFSSVNKFTVGPVNAPIFVGFTVAVVPEPHALLASGIAGVLCAMRRRQS